MSVEAEAAVTRDELKSALEHIEHAFYQKLITGLEAWGNVLLARIDALEQRVLDELKRRLVSETPCPRCHGKLVLPTTDG